MSELRARYPARLVPHRGVSVMLVAIRAVTGTG